MGQGCKVRGCTDARKHTKNVHVVVVSALHSLQGKGTVLMSTSYFFEGFMKARWSVGRLMIGCTINITLFIFA